MTELLLIRHAVNDFVKTGRLAGWTPGVHLNDEGRAQADALARRLAHTRIDALYASPLERTMETAQALLAYHPALVVQPLAEVGEVLYGAWQGAELRQLAKRKLWRAVQINPSRVRFPDGETRGESMREAQLRAVNAIETLAERHPRGVVAVVSHSDIIKMIVAHYLGLHLDLFQRIDIAPASLTILRLGFGRPMLVQVNETSFLPPPAEAQRDERPITEIRPVTSIVIDAVGEPGQRAFYLQAAGDSVSPPVTFALEKPQATMLAAQIDDLFAGTGAAPVPDPGAPLTPPPLLKPERVMFRVGRFTLQYEDQDDLICVVLEELLGAGQGTPRQMRLWATRAQIRAMAEHARDVARRGRPAGGELSVPI